METIAEPVSVLAVFAPDKRGLRPLRIKWRVRVYTAGEIAMHYSQEVDGGIVHVFILVANTTRLMLHYNSRTLVWTLEQRGDVEEAA